jgi:response regulator RpfG family c-di-GMP phosphodiesterase/GGDEF domain-containing protein
MYEFAVALSGYYASALRVFTVLLGAGRVESSHMPRSHAWGRRDAAIATIAVLTAAITGVGLLAGIGLWFFAAAAGALIGGLAVLLAIGMTGAARAAATPGRRTVDPVSGLPGIERLRGDLETECTSANGFGVALYLCVLHGMSAYNEAYGEACGDAMIGWLARKLRDAVGERGTVYRLRGAAFAVVASLAERTDDLQALAASALLEVGEGFVIRGALARALLPEEADNAMAGIELATRRALAQRRARPGDSELRAPEDPMDVLPLERPRYQIADVAARIGRRMGLTGVELENLQAAAHLRDVGNMAVPSAVLTRAGELPGHEWEFVRLHTVVGERLLAANFGMEAVAKLVRSSHERWDGGGYPDGLAGARIPLGARILFVCSAFQDMTSRRAHREARSASDALAELSLAAASQFDPDVVSAFRAEFAPPPETSSPELDRRGHRRLHVLIADDDAASRFLLARAIDAAGETCTSVEDGHSAWEMVRRLRPDVVICDSHLPKLNAERLCRRIRHHEPERETYFVTLVAVHEGERIQRDLDTGADDYLAKPFDRDDLHTLLNVAFNEVSLRRDLG